MKLYIYFLECAQMPCNPDPCIICQVINKVRSDFENSHAGTDLQILGPRAQMLAETSTIYYTCMCANESSTY